MAPLTGEDFHNPELTGPRPSKNIPNGGLFSSYASTKINTPPEIVYDAILHVGEWKEWNTFIYDVKITKNPNPHENAHGRMTGGTCMVFYRNITHDPPEKAEARQVVTLVEKLKLSKDGHSSPCITRIRWQLDNAAISTPGFMLKCERTTEIEESHDGMTIYRTWEVFSGPVARTVRKKFEKPWRDRMQDSCQDLKKWCEEKYARGETAEESGGRGKSEGGQVRDADQNEM